MRIKPRRIRLDLDDVLNTLSLDLLRFDGIDYSSYEAIPNWPWGYNIIQAVADMRGDEEPMGIVEYWERIPRELWANVTLSREFQEILDFCRKAVSLDNVLVATSPTKCPECLAGKYDWMVRHLPKQLHRQWSITPRKWEYGRDKDSLLIDDLEENCEKYSGLGGRAIVVPRPWNKWFGVPVMDAIHRQWEAL